MANGVLASRELAQRTALYSAIKELQNAIQMGSQGKLPTQRTLDRWRGVLSRSQDTAGIQPHLRKKV